MRKVPFESFTLGHLLIIITILYGIIVFLLDAKLTRIQTSLQSQDEFAASERNEIKKKVDHLDWYREQGVDFSYARKFNIKPRKSDNE